MTLKFFAQFISITNHTLCCALASPKVYNLVCSEENFNIQFKSKTELLRLVLFVRCLHNLIFLESFDKFKIFIKYFSLFVSAFLLIGLANGVPMILAGRCIAGFCVGIASLALPVYLGETVQPEVRGTLGLLPTFLGNIGKIFIHPFFIILYTDHMTSFKIEFR